MNIKISVSLFVLDTVLCSFIDFPTHSNHSEAIFQLYRWTGWLVCSKRQLRIKT